MTAPKYKLICETIAALDAAVTTALSEGWTLHGSPSIFVAPDGRPHAVQAVVLTPPPVDPEAEGLAKAKQFIADNPDWA